MLITFEGLDGCGKTTQIEMLEDFLIKRSYPVLTTQEPGWCDRTSRLLKHLIQDEETNPVQRMFLLLADRADHYEKLITQNLGNKYNQGPSQIILCERGPDSTVAYQGFGLGLGSIPWVVDANKIATQGILPDLTFFIDVEPGKAAERSEVAEEHIEHYGDQLYRNIRKGYNEIARVDSGRVVVINGNQSESFVHRSIVDALNMKLSIKRSS